MVNTKECMSGDFFMPRNPNRAMVNPPPGPHPYLHPHQQAQQAQDRQTKVLWDKVIDQIQIHESKTKKECEDQVNAAIDSLILPEPVKHQDLQDRCKSLIDLINHPFFKPDSITFCFIPGLDSLIYSLPSNEFADSLPQDLSNSAIETYDLEGLENTALTNMTHALHSSDPLTYWNDCSIWQEPVYGNYFNSETDYSSYDYYYPYTDNLNQEVMDTECLYDQDFNTCYDDYDYQAYGTSGSIDERYVTDWDTFGDSMDNITSGMSELDVGSVGELFDFGIAIPVFTIGIDVYQQIKLLSQGKTNLATSTKHIVAHAVVSMTGTSVGSAIGSAIVPGVGTVIGALVGAYVANKLYNNSRTSKLKEYIERINQCIQQAHEELNEMVSLIESETRDKVNDELQSIKEEINKRKPEPLKSFLMSDPVIRQFLSNKKVSNGDIITYLKSPQFRNEMMNDQYKSQRLLRLLLVLLDKYKGAWYLWMITAKSEVQKKQGTVAKQFQADLQKINSNIEERNNELEKLTAEAKVCADKLGIDLNSDGKKI